MTIIAIIGSIIIFCITFYGALPHEISLFRRFDLLFRTLFFFFLIGRIGGLLTEIGDTALDWGLAPVVVHEDSIEVFGSLPWVILRFWDSNWYFPGFVLSSVSGFILGTILGDKALKISGSTFNKIIISIFVGQSLILALNILLGTKIVWGQASIFGMDFVQTQLVINIIILILCSILYYVYKIKNLAPVALFIFGFTNLVFGVVVDLWHPSFMSMNTNYIETGMLIVVSVSIFVYLYAHSILAPVSTEGMFIDNRSETRKIGDTSVMRQSWRTRKWNQ